VEDLTAKGAEVFEKGAEESQLRITN